MPVSKSDITPSFIAALELVIEETEFSLCREASTANGCISRETVIIGDDRPEVGDFHRDRSIKSADLDVRKIVCTPDHANGYAWALTIALPLCITHDFGIGTFPSAVSQCS
jgi:hypothetical protein